MKRLLMIAVLAALAACAKTPELQPLPPDCANQVNADNSVTTVCAPTAADFIEVKAQLAALTTAVADVNARIDALPGNATATDLTSINSAITLLQNRVSAVETDIANLKTTTTAQTAAVNALNASLATLSADLATVKASSTSTNVDIATVKSQMAAANASAAAVDSRVTTLETTVAGLSASITTLQTQMTSVITQTSNLLARVAVLESVAPTDLTSINADIAALKAQMTTVQASINGLTTTTNDQATTLANLQASITGINGQLTTLSAAVAASGATNVTALQTDIANLQASTLLANSRLSALETLIDGLLKDPFKAVGAVNTAPAVYGAAPDLTNANGKIVWTLDNVPLSTQELFTLNFRTGFIKADASGTIDISNATSVTSLSDNSTAVYMLTATNDLGYTYPRRRLIIVTDPFRPAQAGATQKLLLFAGLLNSNVMDFESNSFNMNSASVTAGDYAIEANFWPNTMRRRDWNAFTSAYEYVDCAANYAYSATRTDLINLTVNQTGSSITCNPVTEPTKIILYKSDSVETFIYQ